MDETLQRIRLLIVEDNPNDAELMLRELRRGGFEPDWRRVETEADFLAGLSPEPDLILSDYAMPRFSGLKALQLLGERGLKIPFILVSATIGEETAVAAIKEGASDYLLKDRLARLGEATKRVLAEKRLRDERKKSEDRLREMADIVSRAQDAIIARDFDTDRITIWNSGAERLYGWSVSEVIGRPLGEVIFAESNDRATLLERLINTGEFRGEIKHRTKDGREVIVDSRATLVRNDDGTPRSVLGINTDITEQKKLEMQLLRAQRLESIGTLASGVAHDLNNILAPIMMGVAVLRRTKMPADDLALLSIMEACAQRGADVVKQVLAFARGVEGERVPINPPHLVEEIMDIAKKTFPKSIQITGRYPEDLWPIEGDPTQLHQVLLNLFVNARDAMPAGGMLAISVENFPVDEHYASMTPGAKMGPYVLFEVNDTGMGIAPQNVEKIFDPFFTTKELGQGTGLGLSTAIGIVKSHGGFLSVYSEIGCGTTFKVYLPATMEALGTLKETETTVLPPAKGELLLIVDDEKPILQVAQALLEGHGYQVLTAGDATEALALFAIQKDEIKLVLTDLAMPLMDGVALIRTLQKMKPDVRIVASTGQGGREQHAHELESLNVGACLTKPYNKNKLLKTLHDALNHQANHSDPPPQIHAPQ
jgi:two-component system, cell cycle sensor histidine kinase and response regulator CckA